MNNPTATALAQAAQALHASARTHKRSASAHRRSAREDMQKFDALRKQLADLGITLEISSDHGGPSQ